MRKPLAVRVPEKILRVRRIGGGGTLKMTRSRGEVRVTLDEFSCHAAVVFEY